MNNTTTKKSEISNSDKYNECNPRDDSYCIFEKEAKELRETINKVKEWYEGDYHLSKDFEIGLRLGKILGVRS